MHAPACGRDVGIGQSPTPASFGAGAPKLVIAAGMGRAAERVFLLAKIPEAKAVALDSPIFGW